MFKRFVVGLLALWSAFAWAFDAGTMTGVQVTYNAGDQGSVRGTVSYSDDGSAWSVAGTVGDFTGGGTDKVGTWANSTRRRFWKVTFGSSSGGSMPCAGSESSEGLYEITWQDGGWWGLVKGNATLTAVGGAGGIGLAYDGNNNARVYPICDGYGVQFDFGPADAGGGGGLGSVIDGVPETFADIAPSYAVFLVSCMGMFGLGWVGGKG